MVLSNAKYDYEKRQAGKYRRYHADISSDELDALLDYQLSLHGMGLHYFQVDDPYRYEVTRLAGTEE